MARRASRETPKISARRVLQAMALRSCLGDQESEGKHDLVKEKEIDKEREGGKRGP